MVVVVDFGSAAPTRALGSPSPFDGVAACFCGDERQEKAAITTQVNRVAMRADAFFIAPSQQYSGCGQPPLHQKFERRKIVWTSKKPLQFRIRLLLYW